jgi:hypothetical protein
MSKYQNGIQTLSLAASAANASAFLLVSLSKTPRVGVRATCLSCAGAFPIKAGDYTFKLFQNPELREKRQGLSI